jgi:hypothetical protein
MSFNTHIGGERMNTDKHGKDTEKTTKKMLNFRIDPNLHDQLKSVAIATRRTVSDLVITIVRDHIKEYSDVALMDQLKQIPHKERMELINRIQSEEKKNRKGG